MKSRVENGEVIEEFREFVKEWAIFTDDPREQEYQKMVEAFITNALNQQRNSIIKEAKKLQYNYKCPFGCTHKNSEEIDEFLTKLEK